MQIYSWRAKPPWIRRRESRTDITKVFQTCAQATNNERRIEKSKKGFDNNFVTTSYIIFQQVLISETVYCLTKLVKREPLRGTYRGPVGHGIA